VLGATKVEFEIVLVAEVDAVDPWGVNTVGFGIFALMIFERLVGVHEVHETFAVVGGFETEVAIGHLLVGWNVDGIIEIAIAVDIVGSHVAVVVAAAPCFIDETIVIAALVVDRRRSYEAVGGYILRIMELDVVRTLYGRNIGEGRFRIRARHPRHFL